MAQQLESLHTAVKTRNLGRKPGRLYPVWCAFSETASRPLIGTGLRWQNSVVESTSPVLPRH